MEFPEDGFDFFALVTARKETSTEAQDSMVNTVEAHAYIIMGKKLHCRADERSKARSSRATCG